MFHRVATLVQLCAGTPVLRGVSAHKIQCFFHLCELLDCIIDVGRSSFFAPGAAVVVDADNEDGAVPVAVD